MPPVRLDLRRLKKDVAATPSRGEALAPGGRPATGLMKIVRENLDELLAMQSSGTTWATIAAALTAQGFMTADGRPVTGPNLTGIISSVRRQKQRQADRKSARAQRSDLGTEVASRKQPRDLAAAAAARPDRANPTSRHRLAPELHARREEPADGGGPIGEDEIRRLQTEKHKNLFNKG